MLHLCVMRLTSPETTPRGVGMDGELLAIDMSTQVALQRCVHGKKSPIPDAVFCMS